MIENTPGGILGHGPITYTRYAADSHAFSRLLTPSHAFSRLLTPSHTFSHLLTPSQSSDLTQVRELLPELDELDSRLDEAPLRRE